MWSTCMPVGIRTEMYFGDVDSIVTPTETVVGLPISICAGDVHWCAAAGGAVATSAAAVSAVAANTRHVTLAPRIGSPLRNTTADICPSVRTGNHLFMSFDCQPTAERTRASCRYADVPPLSRQRSDALAAQKLQGNRLRRAIASSPDKSVRS